MTPAALDSTGLVHVDAVTHAYGHDVVLDRVSLSLGERSFVGIVGPSGSGKTTLLRVILGTLLPRRGSVLRRPGLRIGYVPQLETVDWNFPVTVGECVAMAQRPVGRRRPRWPWPSADERRETSALLERLGLGGLERRHIRELSGGQQQRVFVARALVGDPQLLVLDEPTSGLDVRTRHELLHLLEELHGAGMAIVLSTHDLNGLAAHLPELLCLNRMVIAAGPTRRVLTPDVLERTYGAPMEVLEHAGLPLVVEGHRAEVIPLHRDESESA